MGTRVLQRRLRWNERICLVPLPPVDGECSACYSIFEDSMLSDGAFPPSCPPNGNDSKWHFHMTSLSSSSSDIQLQYFPHSQWDFSETWFNMIPPPPPKENHDPMPLIAILTRCICFVGANPQVLESHLLCTASSPQTHLLPHSPSCCPFNWEYTPLNSRRPGWEAWYAYLGVSPFYSYGRMLHSICMGSSHEVVFIRWNFRGKIGIFS